MKRQDFLKKASVALVALAFILSPANIPAAPSSVGDVRVFFFVAHSQAAPLDPHTVPRIGLTGGGRFTPERGEVQGGGSYFRDNAADAVPRPLLDFGTWQPTDIVSFSPVPGGTFGRITAAVLVLHIRLVSDVDSSVSTGTLTLICNIGDAGITTGQTEGFKLTIDGTSFGEFAPLTPVQGITHIGLLATP